VRELIINGNVYDDSTKPYLIAEVGHNHQGKLEVAIELIRTAAANGANAVKFQKRDNKILFTKKAFNSPYVNENSYGPTYGEHREALEFGKKEYQECMGLASELGIDFFATAFDLPSVDFLMDIDVPAIKVASGDLKSLQLLKYLAQTMKPLIISTGGAKIEDVLRAHETISEFHSNFAILQCTAGYPPKYEELNLRVIDTYRNLFPDNVIGYSGHDSGIAMALVSYILGARVIEKHFTLNRAMKGTDHSFSLEPKGLNKLVRDLDRAFVALGDGVKNTYESEIGPINKMSKSIYFKEDLQKGVVLKENHFIIKSPGGGIEPYKMIDFLGMELKIDVNAEDPLNLDHI
jgi:sialic acid synthase